MYSLESEFDILFWVYSTVHMYYTYQAYRPNLGEHFDNLLCWPIMSDPEKIEVLSNPALVYLLLTLKVTHGTIAFERQTMLVSKNVTCNFCNLPNLGHVTKKEAAPSQTPGMIQIIMFHTMSVGRLYLPFQ